MAGNAPERWGRDLSARDRERDSKRVPARIASREHSPPSGAVSKGRGGALLPRAVASSNPLPSSSSSSHHRRPRSRSRGRYHARERSPRRSISPPREDRARRHESSSQLAKLGQERTSQAERQPSPALSIKRRYEHSTSPSPARRPRDTKRRRSHSRGNSPTRSRAHERSVSPRPARDDRYSRRPSPAPYHSTHHRRRRSRSTNSRYRPQETRNNRRPSPGGRARARDDGRHRYRSPPRFDRRRYSPPPHPSRRGYRDDRDAAYPSRDRHEDYYGTRHSKPAARGSHRGDTRRSESPDLISKLATTNRRDDDRSSRQAERQPRRRSRSRDTSRREYAEDPHYRDRNHTRGDRDYQDRRDRYHDDRPDDAMYGRGVPPRGPPGGYVDPRYPYAHSPPYPPTAQSPAHGYSPYGRGGYPPQPGYGGYHPSPAHAYSPPPLQASPYYAQGYPPPTASPYYAPQAGHYAAAPPHQPYPQQGYPPAPSSYRGAAPPAPRGSSYGPRPAVPAAAPAAAAARTSRGHFANLSWTPNQGSKGGKATPAGQSSSGGVTPAAQGGSQASVDDEDNPFRPPPSLRADVDMKDRSATPERKTGISFSIKGVAKKEPPPPPKPTTRKEIVVRRRLKPKPRLTQDFAASDSVYYRKTGNESVVGSGTYGKVYKAVHVYTNDKVALKKIRMEGERDGFPVTAIREVKLLQSLNHLNVVKLQEVMVERNDCYMIFEYLSHDLTGLLNHPSFTLTEAHKKHLAQQLFEGLDYLHKRGVLHRDIKAANILVSRDGVLKLADFGLARFYNKHTKRKQDYTNRVITIWYRSPELLLGETQYGPSVDIWSAACVLVEIFTRHAIFPGDGGEINQLDKIYNVLGTPSRSDWPGIADLAWYELLRPMHKVAPTFEEKYRDRVSPEGFELLKAMFLYDPALRPTAADVLEHPYFSVEEPRPTRAWELRDLEGDWHEFESKALRKEKEREARRRDRESGTAEKEKDNKRKVAAAVEGAGAGTEAGERERESKRPRNSDVLPV